MRRLVQAQVAAGAADAESGSTGRWGLAGLSMATLLASLGTSIANVALPTLAASFDAPFQDVQWVVLAYLLAVTTLIVGMGRLGDIFGRRRLLLAGIAVFAAASLLCGAASSLWVLVAARAAQGAGAAVMMALAMALVGETVARERIGSAMGLLGATSAVGTALGPSLGGVLIAWAGWRAVFLVGVPLALLAAFLAWRGLRTQGGPTPIVLAEPARPRFDHKGSALLALTLAAYAVAMTVGRGGPGWLNFALLSAAGIGAVLFLRFEARADAPLVRPAMLRDPVLATGLLTSALVATVMMATLVVGPFHLARALGLDEAGIGLVISVGPIVAALTGFPAGRLADRFGARRTAVAGLVAMGAGAVLLSLLPATLGIPGYVGPLVVVTAGYALFQTGNNSAVMAEVPLDRRGVTSGLLGLSRNLGLITGASAMGAVFALASGTPDIAAAPAEAVGAATRVTFAVAAALIVAALAVAAAGQARSRHRTTSPDRGAIAG